MLIISISFDAFSINKSLIIYNNYDEAKTLIRIFLNSQNLQDYYKDRTKYYQDFGVENESQLSELLIERLVSVLYENGINVCACEQLHIDLVDQSNGDF